MSTRLIQLSDGTLVEVETTTGQPEQIAHSLAEHVDSSLEQVRDLLIKTCRPVVAAWREINKEMIIDSTEIEIGVSFEGEGNLYITKAKAGANLTIRIKLTEIVPAEEH